MRPATTGRDGASSWRPTATARARRHAGDGGVEGAPGAGPGRSRGQRVARRGCLRDGDLIRRGGGGGGRAAGQVDARGRQQRQDQQGAEQVPGTAGRAAAGGRPVAGWGAGERGAGGRAVWRASAVAGGAVARGGSGRHVSRPSRGSGRTVRGRPLVSRNRRNPCGRDTRGSGADFREFGGYGRRAAS